MLNTPDDGKILWTILGLMNVSAKNPSTTQGIPASISIIGFRVRRARGRGVLREVDGRTQSQRRRDEHGDTGDDERPDHDGAEVEQAAPRKPPDRPQRGDLSLLYQAADERPGLPDEREDDRDADENRDETRGEEDRPDETLPVASPRISAEVDGWLMCCHVYLAGEGRRAGAGAALALRRVSGHTQVCCSMTRSCVR